MEFVDSSNRGPLVVLKSDCEAAKFLAFAGVGFFPRGGMNGSEDPVEDPKILSFSIPLLLNRDPAGEFPCANGPRGTKELVGTPAGVVETSLKKLRDLLGVDGESGS